MLSLSKRNNDLSEAEPLWHPNFRNFERLPDTKVVRTTFFVNAAAIAISLTLALWWGYREYHIRNLAQQVVEAQKQIDDNTKQNKEAIRLSQVFSGEEKKLADAEAFLHSPISVSEFIGLLGQSLPREILIEAVDIRLADAKNQMFALRGLVAGSRDQASGSASSYIDLLKNHPKLGAVFDPVTLERLNPDGATGMLSFDISMKVKPEGKK